MAVLHCIPIHEALLESYFLILFTDLTCQFSDYDPYWRGEITAVSEPVDEAIGYLIHSQAEWCWIVPFKSELGHGPGAQRVLIRNVIVLIPIHVVTYRCPREKLDEVL